MDSRLRVPGKQQFLVVYFLQQVDPIIEVIRHSARRTLLDPSPKRIVLERHYCRAVPRVRQRQARQTVLEVPGVLRRPRRVRLRQRVSVVVVGVGRCSRSTSTGSTRCSCRQPLQRGQPIPYGVVGVALRSHTPLGYLQQLIKRVIGVVRGCPVQVVGLRRAIAGRIIGVARPIHGRGTRLMPIFSRSLREVGLFGQRTRPSAISKIKILKRKEREGCAKKREGTANPSSLHSSG